MKEITQIGTSACGATAVLNILVCARCIHVDVCTVFNKCTYPHCIVPTYHTTGKRWGVDLILTNVPRIRTVLMGAFDIDIRPRGRGNTVKFGMKIIILLELRPIFRG